MYPCPPIWLKSEGDNYPARGGKRDSVGSAPGKSALDLIDAGEAQAEVFRHGCYLGCQEVVEHEAGLGQSHQLTTFRLGDAEDDIAAILVQVHQTHFKHQGFPSEGFAPVGGGQIGNYDADIIDADFLDAELV